MSETRVEVPTRWPVVKGEYVGHSENLGFRYRYTCEDCGKRFLSSAPEANAPVQCHACHHGITQARKSRATANLRREKRRTRLKRSHPPGDCGGNTT